MGSSVSDSQATVTGLVLRAPAASSREGCVASVGYFRRDPAAALAGRSPTGQQLAAGTQPGANPAGAVALGGSASLGCRRRVIRSAAQPLAPAPSALRSATVKAVAAVGPHGSSRQMPSDPGARIAPSQTQGQGSSLSTARNSPSAPPPPPTTTSKIQDSTAQSAATLTSKLLWRQQAPRTFSLRPRSAR